MRKNLDLWHRFVKGEGSLKIECSSFPLFNISRDLSLVSMVSYIKIILRNFQLGCIIGAKSISILK